MFATETVLPWGGGFTENRGQWPGDVLFMARTPGGTAWFLENGFTLDGKPVEILGSSGNIAAAGIDPLPHLMNFFLGNDPSRWRTGVRSFRGLIYRNAYPGIDLLFSLEEGDICCEKVTGTGGDPSMIAFSLEIPEPGARTAPASDEETLDPVRTSAQVSLMYSTYLGGGAEDRSYSIAVDSQGRTYVTGRTGSADFPVWNPYQGVFQGGDWDAFVARFSPDGSQLEFATFIGGSGNENGYGVKVDNQGGVCLTGPTESADFPVVNPLQPALSGVSDAFVLKLSSEGNELVYSTFLGGSGTELGRDIAVDGFGRALVTGTTSSADFPLANPFQSQYAGGAGDAFCVMLSTSGDDLVYGTYMGGAGNDAGEGVFSDVQGNGYYCGQTGSPGFPVKNPFQGVFGGGSIDGYLARLSPDGQQVFGTFLGGAGDDLAHNVFADQDGGSYLTGETGSADFPLLNPFQGALPGTAAMFVSRLTPDGENLSYSTYIGGSGLDQGRDIAVSATGSAFVTGYTSSTDFPVVNAYQEFHAGGGNDVVVLKLSQDGSQLEYSTYLGGSGNDSSRGIAVHSDGSASVTGGVFSTDFPLWNPYQGTFGGGLTDCFVARLGPYGTWIEGESVPRINGMGLLYENPFSGVLSLTVTTTSPGPLQVTVLDLTGRIVERLCCESGLAAGEHRFAWNARGNPRGVYFIRAEDGSASVRGKTLLL